MKKRGIMSRDVQPIVDRLNQLRGTEQQPTQKGGVTVCVPVVGTLTLNMVEPGRWQCIEYCGNGRARHFIPASGATYTLDKLAAELRIARDKLK